MIQTSKTNDMSHKDDNQTEHLQKFANDIQQLPLIFQIMLAIIGIPLFVVIIPLFAISLIGLFVSLFVVGIFSWIVNLLCLQSH